MPSPYPSSNLAAREKTLLIGHADEVELLARNVAHHFAVGFTNIVVVTASRDEEAAEVVSRFDRRRTFHYVVDEMGGDPFDLFAGPTTWATTVLATPWLAFCDTDEFIVSRSGSVRNTRATAIYDLVAIPRFTVVPDCDDAGNVAPLDFSNVSGLPIFARTLDVKRAWLSGDRSVPYVFAKDAPKIFARTSFVDGIVPGGHGAITRRPFLTRSIDEDLMIVHAPFTTYPRFARKVTAIRAILARYGDRLAPEDAWHWRSWAALDDVALEAEFRAQLRPALAREFTTARALFAASDGVPAPSGPQSFDVLKSLVRYGEPIERRDLPRWIEIAFDAAWYVQHNQDVRVGVESATIDPLEHFLTLGIAEGRSPRADFDPHFTRQGLERITENYIDLRDVYWLYFSLPQSQRPPTVATR